MTEFILRQQIKDNSDLIQSEDHATIKSKINDEILKQSKTIMAK